VYEIRGAHRQRRFLVELTARGGRYCTQSYAGRVRRFGRIEDDDNTSDSCSWDRRLSTIFVDPIAGMAFYGPTVARPELRGRITRSA
jgi:hypothetical protein